MKKILLFLVRFYQLALSPFLGTNCRYEPGCSHYAQEAISQHGAIKGSLLALRRVLRCHPFAAHGFDPVPPHFEIIHRRN
jgi:putative membrane protein insertion efficiency factor